MREILFRAKLKRWKEIPEENQLVDGGYAKVNGAHYIIPEEPMWCDNVKAWVPRHWEIDSSTLGQFTGFPDKDGTLIFDGDILEFHYDDLYPENVTYSVVKWGDGEWTLIEDGYYTPDSFRSEDAAKAKVVGNIWDNPELVGRTTHD